MGKNEKIRSLNNLGQSIWYDNIQRSKLVNKELSQLIKDGVIQGITSNPSIFHNAIGKSNDYDLAMMPMAWAGYSSEDIFVELSIDDIQQAADLFLPLYESSNKKDGYVSLEVNPLLANQTEETINEAKKLWKKVNRPNLMIKIPATKAGIPAITETIAAGLNVNVTLIFSVSRYEEVMEAYYSGLESRLANGESIEHIHSVASFFVSRMDSKVDSYLDKIIQAKPNLADTAKPLLGKSAIANTILAYDAYKNVINHPGVKSLIEKGANLQRPLWASTSTKNANYSDILYIESLVAENTVNTVPPQTLEAFLDHGIPQLSLEKQEIDAVEIFSLLEKLGISLKAVTDELESEGVLAFSNAYNSLLESIEEKRLSFANGISPVQNIYKETLVEAIQNDIQTRIQERDANLWSKDSQELDEIKKRLNWLDAPEKSSSLVDDAEKLKSDLLAEGYEHAVVLGMGGSSLAPEVMSLINESLGNSNEGLSLSIIDSTNPEQILENQESLQLDKTLFIVSSKSGTTAETLSLYQYFWQVYLDGNNRNPGNHFIAITDPGSKLEKIGTSNAFRKLFHADPEVGGRYSALIAFGIVPAVLCGIDGKDFLLAAQETVRLCQKEDVSQNPGLSFGLLLAAAYKKEKDKLTIRADEKLNSFGSWVEQLIAESSGKNRKGIVPIDREPQVDLQAYSTDRLFVNLISEQTENETSGLIEHKHSVVTLSIKHISDLSSQFYFWEYATAAACAELNINAFNQPDVQDNKSRTNTKIDQFKSRGHFDDETPALTFESADIFLPEYLKFDSIQSLDGVLNAIVSLQKDGDYAAINAYLPRNPQIEELLQTLRSKLLHLSNKPVTLGFGPRFLHSTGQLHKGGPDNGVYLQITQQFEKDIPIPGNNLSFARLIEAQAAGDFEALTARNRRIIRLHLHDLELLKNL